MDETWVSELFDCFQELAKEVKTLKNICDNWSLPREDSEHLADQRPMTAKEKERRVKNPKGETTLPNSRVIYGKEFQKKKRRRRSVIDPLKKGKGTPLREKHLRRTLGSQRSHGLEKVCYLKGGWRKFRKRKHSGKKKLEDCQWKGKQKGLSVGLPTGKYTYKQLKRSALKMNMGMDSRFSEGKYKKYIDRCCSRTSTW